jgi:hypothetical protein
MKALKSITLEQFADATAIVCNITFAAVFLALAALTVLDALAVVLPFQQIAVDCVRSL